MNEATIAIISVIVAVFAALVSAYFSVRTLKALSIGHRLQYAAVKDQYFAGLRQWADVASDALTEAMHLCELDPAKCKAPSFFERRWQMRIRISSLIDRGRFFFPNRKPGELGHGKTGAFHGHRLAIIDALILAHDLTSEIDYCDSAPNAELRDMIMKQKRIFISQVQEVLNPRARDSEFEKIMEMAISVAG